MALDLGAEGLGDNLGVLGLQLRLDLAGNLQKFSVSRLPDFEKRPRIESSRNWAALVQTLFERLAD